MPEKIGNYDVISVLGRGTFGKVFRVRSIRSPGATGPPKEYAIKVIFEKFSVSSSYTGLLLTFTACNLKLNCRTIFRISRNKISKISQKIQFQKPKMQ